MLHIKDERRIFNEKYWDEKLKISIGKDTVIEPGAVIYDNCKIGESCIIGTSAVLKSNTEIGDHSIFGTLSATEGNLNVMSLGEWKSETMCLLLLFSIRLTLQ